MPDRAPAERDVLDKLGIKPGAAVAFVAAPRGVDGQLRARVLERVGRPPAWPGEPVDVVLVGADASADVLSVLLAWRPRLEVAGGIWLLTPVRGQPGYVDQRILIEVGLGSGMVDNKTCRVSETTSGLRFVIRKVDRVYS